MTQEDEKLLLIDLAARAPYKVKISLEFDADKLIGTLDAVYPSENRVIVDNLNKAIAAINVRCGGFILNENNVKPYLRPISSMMQGEWDEMTALIYPYGRVNCNPDNKNELLLWLSVEGNDMPIILMDNVFSWLNAHHFDYRGLIEKGLALKAPEDMYK